MGADLRENSEERKEHLFVKSMTQSNVLQFPFLIDEVFFSLSVSLSLYLYARKRVVLIKLRIEHRRQKTNISRRTLLLLLSLVRGCARIDPSHVYWSEKKR